jgi:prevent-host-death family protein
MAEVNITRARAHLSELVERVANGDTVLITRRGVPVARLVRVPPARKRIDIEALREITKAMPRQRMGAGAFLRRMRDGSRY